jgi:gluconolactonase
MKCDEHGNVWCTGPGGIWVIDPDGQRIGVIQTPELAANLGWGGAEGTTLFVTASTQLLRLETRVRGAVRSRP